MTPPLALAENRELATAPNQEPSREYLHAGRLAHNIRLLAELEEPPSDSIRVALERERLLAEIPRLIADTFPAIRKAFLPPAPTELLTAQDAARELGYLKPDGRVKDSFYRNVAPKIGYRDGKAWRFSADRVTAHRRGGNHS